METETQFRDITHETVHLLAKDTIQNQRLHRNEVILNPLSVENLHIQDINSFLFPSMTE